MKRSLLSFFACALFLLSLTTAANAETFFAYLTPAQEVPPTSSSASGYARVHVNESTLTLTFTVVFNNLTSAQTGAHIHAPAAIGANAAVAINFETVGGTSGTITGTRSITATQLAQIRQHLGYVNVHSMNNPGGEIRGQLGIKRPVDFDGDGRQDFSVLNFPNIAPPGVAPIEYWNLNSTTGIQIESWGDANRDFPVPGDYDGDGKDDLALYRAGASPGDFSAFYIFRSGTSTAQIVSYGLSGDQAHCRDYDGDGTTDMAIFRRGAAVGAPAYWWIRQSSTGGTDRVDQFGTTGTATGSTLDTPVSGDYDGDGKFDLAVYRFGIAPTNTYIIKRSSDNTVEFKQFGNFQSDYILPGDYDGDGKYDLAVARTGSLSTSPLVWWIQFSSTNLIRVQTWGISSDLPVQGDYDGDARTDMAVFRRGAAGQQSTFWVLGSFANDVLLRRWGTSTSFPVATFDAR